MTNAYRYYSANTSLGPGKREEKIKNKSMTRQDNQLYVRRVLIARSTSESVR